MVAELRIVFEKPVEKPLQPLETAVTANSKLGNLTVDPNSLRLTFDGNVLIFFFNDFLD